MYQHKIINISAIIFYMQFIFYKTIEIMQINIAEKLRGKISYRQTAIFGRMKKAFRSRKIFPIGT